MKKATILLATLFINCFLFAQTSNCKVINKELKGVYKGECKSGLANGFGVFTFENGMFVYEGEFVKGKMHGKGEMYSNINNDKKLVSKGTWKENVYVKEKSSKPFEVISSVNVERNTVRKVGEGNRIFINNFRNGDRNKVENLNISLSSGNQMIGSSIVGYDNLEFPVRCEITYRTPNKIGTYSLNVRYVVVINEPGEWHLFLYN